MTDKIEISLETTTPLFLGGAYSRPDEDHSGNPEIRPPTFRGALRYWPRGGADPVGEMPQIFRGQSPTAAPRGPDPAGRHLSS